MDEQRLEKMDKLARDILTLSRNTLLVNLRFLDAALSQFQYVRCDTSTLLTDGHYLLYNPPHVLQCYKHEKEIPVRDYLHIVLHCIYRHMFMSPNIDRPLWDLACDIAVESTITGLGLPSAAAGREAKQKAVLDKLSRELKLVTAEKIYRYYLDAGLTPAQAADLRALFYADDHEIWYMTVAEIEVTYGVSLSGGYGSGDGEGEGQGGGDGDGQQEQDSEGAGGLAQVWKDISERIQQDLETFSRGQGDRVGNMMQNLRAVNRERYDYESFLRKFAVRGEVMKINPDEFDYIFYTYGLQLYEKMPLIEPLEYREVKRIREFVIAIDTSGSVAGDLVQTFLQKTYNVLKSTESFFSKINLHIIQCDADIQEDVKITGQEEFDEYLQTMTLRGLGGTDFRPVFRRVDEMVQNHEFINLKGLIYFTDGYGTFPERKPDYDAAFVFIDDEYNNPDVPPWAIKLVLQKEEI